MKIREVAIITNGTKISALKVNSMKNIVLRRGNYWTHERDERLMAFNILEMAV